MTMPLELLLIRLSAEFDRLAAMASRIEATMDHDVNAGRPDSRIMQNMDLLTQTLVDLSRFGTALSKVAPDIRVDLAPALETMRLGAVASRLSGHDLNVDSKQGDVSVF